MHQEQKHDVHKLQGSADISAKSDIVFLNIFYDYSRRTLATKNSLSTRIFSRLQRYFEE